MSLASSGMDILIFSHQIETETITIIFTNTKLFLFQEELVSIKLLLGSLFPNEQLALSNEFFDKWVIFFSLLLKLLRQNSHPKKK